MEKSSKYKTILTCGYCGKKTEISDKSTGSIMTGKTEIYNMCSCNHTSYNSSLNLKQVYGKIS